jgi:hypothetical protein
VTFEAEGVAVDGQKPVLQIDGPCQTGDDMNYLAPIEIPFAQLKNQSPRQQQFTFGSSHVMAINNPDGWPRQWALSAISLTNDQDPSKVISISHEQIIKNLNKPVLMNW